MNRAYLLLPVLLAGCHSGPSVTAQNASVNEVNARLAESGAAAAFLSAGHWDSTITVHSVDVPGLPPAATAQMKAALAKPQSSQSCLTPEEAKKPAGSFFAGNNSDDCRYDHFTMSGGAIDAVMQCKSEGSTQTTTLKGAYSADTFHIDMTSKGVGKPSEPLSSMTMAMTIDGKRTGPCTGKEDNADN